MSLRTTPWLLTAEASALAALSIKTNSEEVSWKGLNSGSCQKKLSKAIPRLIMDLFLARQAEGYVGTGGPELIAQARKSPPGAQLHSAT